MRLLLDTHVLLWAADNSAAMPPDILRLIEDQDNLLHFSAASIWEIAIKNARGRSDFQANPTRLRRLLLDNGYEELVVTGEHAIAGAELPLLHKDPFDRLLIAQAIAEDLTLLTVDQTMMRYPGLRSR